MKSESQENKKKPEKPAAEEGENLGSTRLFFKSAPKVPGIDTGIYFRKIFKGKGKKPGKE